MTSQRFRSTEVNNARSPEELSECLMDSIRIMHFEAAVLLLPQDKGLVPKGGFGYDTQSLEQWRIPSDGMLARHLINTSQVRYPRKRERLLAELRIAWEELTPDERRLLQNDDVQLWLPLVSKEALQGLLLLGRCQGKAVLNKKDRDILVPLAGQAALAAENIALLDAIRKLQIEMQQMRDELTEAHHRLVESREAEQLRLARELHDGAVQQLLGISYQLANSAGVTNDTGQVSGTALPATPVETKLRDELESSGNHVVLPDASNPPRYSLTGDTIRQEVLGVVSQLRNLIGELRPPGLEEFGLPTALEGYIAKVQREVAWEGQKVPVIRANIASGEPDLSEAAALTLFRTTQEALRNALKHAYANQIEIQLQISATEANLTIRDDGCGFQVPARLGALAGDHHFGLIGMMERIESVGGRLTVESQPGRGTQILASVPLNKGERKRAWSR